MKLSIVIVNYNVKYFLDQCLRSIRRSKTTFDYEIIVVDNNSGDGSVSFIKKNYPGLHLIANDQNLGFSKASNMGIRQAGGKFVLLLNPDTLLRENTLQECMRFMESHPDCGALGVKMLDGSGHFLPESKRGLPTPFVAFCKVTGLSGLFPRSAFFNHYHLGHLHSDEVHEVEVLSGAFMFIRGQALKEAGLLDERFFMYGEDIDLSCRIGRAGYKLYYLGHTHIIHFKGESTKKSSLKYHREFYRAMHLFARKHFHGGRGRLFGLMMNVGILLRGMVSLVKSLTQQLLKPLAAIALLAAAFLLAKWAWATVVYGDSAYYPEEFYYINLPVYVLLHTLAFYFNALFHKPAKAGRLARGLVWGLIACLIAYALLPEAYRSSRAIPVIGALLAFPFLWAATRLTGGYGKKAGGEILLAGSAEEVRRARYLLQQSGEGPLDIRGFVSTQTTEDPDCLGQVDMLEDIVERFGIGELIFCQKDFGTDQVIHYISRIGSKVKVRLFSEDALAIVGSHSRDRRGEVYTMEVHFRLAEAYYRQLKRIVDMVSSFLILLISPLVMWFYPRPFSLPLNAWYVFTGRLTWVGYIGGDALRHELPSLRKCVLTHSDLKSGTRPAKVHRLNFLYASEYHPLRDVQRIFNGFLKLDG